MSLRELVWSLKTTGFAEATKQVKGLDKEVNGVKGSIQKADGITDKLSKGVDELGGKLKRAGDNSSKFGKKLMLGTAPLAIGLKKAISTGAEFEHTISRVGAVANVEGKKLDNLKDKALDLAKGTKFTATEVADGMSFAGMAGWTYQEIMEGMPGILDLAAAGNADLATTSDIVTDALSAFNLEASQSTRFADILSKTVTSTNTDVEGLGEAFKYVAPLAGTMNYEVEDVSAILGTMADNGIKGGQAGRVLRTALTRLIKPPKEAADALGMMNIRAEELQGLTLDETITKLRDGFSKLDESQQAQAAASIFGQDAMSGMLAVLNTGEDEFQALRSELYASEGAARGLAATMQDNLQGSMDQLKSTTEAAGIKFGEAITPVLRDLIEGATGLIDKFSELDSATMATIGQWMMLAVAAGPVIFAGGKILGVVGSLLGIGVKVISGIGTIAGLFGSVLPAAIGFLFSPLGGIIAVVGGVIAIGINLVRNWGEVKAKAEELGGGIKGYLFAALEVTGEGFTKLLDKGRNAIDGLKNAWEGAKEFFKNPIQGTVNIVKKGASLLTGKSGIDGTHATGLNYVPKDNYVANLHQGEMVLTRRASQEYRSLGGTRNSVPSRNKTTFNPTVVVNVQGSSQDGQSIADAVRVEMSKMFREWQLQEV